jgi:hypothetical protein
MEQKPALSRVVAIAAFAALAGCAEPRHEPAEVAPPVVWRVDSLDTIGGHPVLVLGSPAVVGSAGDRALEFDGIDDGVELPLHPLAGASTFTVEVIFRPDAGGPREQRFLHLQEDASKDRILLETRTTGDGSTWFLDSYVKSKDEGYTLFAKQHEHPIGPWYHAALVVDGSRMHHYVNGELELTRPIDFRPQTAGRTSIGVRINRVSWFKGAIREIRFTRRALEPEEFLRAQTAGSSTS